MEKETQKDQNRSSRQKPFNEYVKYSGLALQMGIFMYLGYWAGQKLDAKTETSFPTFTVVLVFVALGFSFYSIFRSLPKE